MDFGGRGIYFAPKWVVSTLFTAKKGFIGFGSFNFRSVGVERYNWLFMVGVMVILRFKTPNNKKIKEQLNKYLKSHRNGRIMLITQYLGKILLLINTS